MVPRTISPTALTRLHAVEKGSGVFSKTSDKRAFTRDLKRVFFERQNFSIA